MEKEADLCKLVVELGYHWSGIGGEGIWARPMGGDLYEVDNIPFYAYGLVAGGFGSDPDEDNPRDEEAG
jgi:hypothetical protein